MSNETGMSGAGVAAWVESQHWAIHPGALRGLLAGALGAPAAGAGMSVRGAADDPVGPGFWWRGEWIPFANQVQVFDGVAVLPVHGMVLKGAPAWAHAWFGPLADLRIIDEQLANVAEDSDVHALVLDLDTPGGTVTGGQRTCGLLERVRASGKELVAYTDTMACSMGYKLAAGCDVILAEQSALVGSISTFQVGYDTSKMAEKMGAGIELFRTGDLKATGIFGKEWTEKERDFLQEQTDLVGADFKDYVAERRGLGDEVMQGGYWQAQHSPEGVVDGLMGSLEEVIAGLHSF